MNDVIQPVSKFRAEKPLDGFFQAVATNETHRIERSSVVVLPQAIRNVLPALGNESIALFKDTSLAMVIAIPELMMRGKQAAARDFRTLEVYSVVAVIYLVTVILMTRVQRHLERRFGAGTAA